MDLGIFTTIPMWLLVHPKLIGRVDVPSLSNKLFQSVIGVPYL